MTYEQTQLLDHPVGAPGRWQQSTTTLIGASAGAMGYAALLCGRRAMGA
jgi:hypothetical protein